MKKRLLSIITSVSLISSVFSFGVSAVPSAVDTVDTGLEVMPEPIIEQEYDAILASEGPTAVDIIEPAEETNTEYGTPELFGGAVLFSDLSGDGTEESPYLIGTADELKAMADNINTGVDTNAYYKLTSDIDLGGCDWTPMGYVTGVDPNTDYSKAFRGHFDGDGHTVSNFTITKSSPAYIGFFGFVYDGTVKNLNIDSATFNITTDATSTLYVGGIVGRVVANARNSRSNIINCNITNSDISVVNGGTVYAGGILGAGVAGAYNGAQIFIGFSNAECNLDISTKSISASELVATGGLVGYYGSFTGSKITAINCHASGNVHASALLTSGSRANALAGGAFGNLRAFESLETNKPGGAIYIDSCYSEGTVVAETDYNPYFVGGFMAQFMPTDFSYISNCYSSSDASGKHLQKLDPYQPPNNEPAAGGFVGVITFPAFTTRMSKKIINCYAEGDAVDLTHKEGDLKSYVGRFSGYSNAGTFKNCYKLASQNVWGTYVFADDLVTLSQDDAKYYDKYVGFDYVNTWDFDADAEYPYPTLKEKTGFVDFVVDGVSFATTVFGSNGRVIKPETDPEKNPTVDKVFKFNYWSLSENGAAFNFGSDTVSESTVLYAVFTSEPRPYKVNFISEDTAFVPEQIIPYGSLIAAPEEIPTKEDNETYFYEFLYWSESKDGAPAGFTDFTVKGDHTFYAVFEEIDKSAWRGDIAESFSYGYGTESSPYIIRTSDEFALLAVVINEQREGYVDAYYALGNDVNLGGNNWIPVGSSAETPFKGHFDGRGYRVRNFVLSNNKYNGLFGYAVNAEFKNVHINNFKMNVTIQKEESEHYNIYAGGLVGYLSAKDGFATNVSCVRVSDFEINANLSTEYFYLSPIAGYAVAEAKSTVSISDCFATGNIPATNPGGYNYIGGIVGTGEMKSKSSFLISHCYFDGDITTVSYRSSHAAGIAGYLKSSGSAYLPDVGTTSSEDSSLSVDDSDIMASDCFAIVNITSSTSGPYSRSAIGYLVGELNQFASIKNLLYPLTGVSLNPASGNSKIGDGTRHANLKSEDSLKANLGFDFENTWIFTPESQYPVLKCMVVTKNALRMKAEFNEENALDISVHVVSPDDVYTLIIGVYNARNQLIKAERINPANDEIVEINKSYENLDSAVKVSVSAINRFTLKPLFESVSVDLTQTEI